MCFLCLCMCLCMCLCVCLFFNLEKVAPFSKFERNYTLKEFVLKNHYTTHTHFCVVLVFLKFLSLSFFFFSNLTSMDVLSAKISRKIFLSFLLSSFSFLSFQIFTTKQTKTNKTQNKTQTEIKC